jgi:hypothetical protein
VITADLDSGGSRARPFGAPVEAAAAFLAYCILSFFFFGRGLIGHLSDRYIGFGPDPGVQIWFLAWFHHAIVHHLNPFIADVVWVPQGFNVGWAHTSPLANVILAPVTGAFGPVAAHNLLDLVSMALAGWAAFILCRHLTKRFWPAFAGGYLFAFSPCTLAHVLGPTHLLMVFPIPLAVWLVLLRLEGGIGRASFAAWLALVVIAQFLLDIEILATGTLFGAIAFALGWYLATPEYRAKLRRMIAPALCAYIGAAVVLSPYLYYLFVAFGRPNFPGAFAQHFVAHLPMLLIPPPTTWLGQWPLLRGLSVGCIYEVGEYVGLPALLILISVRRSCRDEKRFRLPLLLFVATWIASMGGVLKLRGGVRIPMPWALAEHLPLLRNATPQRLIVYASLSMAVIMALWLAQDFRPRALRIAAAVAVFLFLLPNPSSSYWVSGVDAPAFFSTGLYRKYLSPGENVVVLPYGFQGDTDVWQANTDMYFRMAGGYVGVSPPVPPSFQHFPIVYALCNLGRIPDQEEALKTFLVRKHVSAIIVPAGGKHRWQVVSGKSPTVERGDYTSGDREFIRGLLGTLGVAPLKVGGVWLYKVPLEKLAPYERVEPRELELRCARRRLEATIVASDAYLARGLAREKLNPLALQRAGLLPPSWIAGPYVREVGDISWEGDGIIAMVSGRDRITVGILGSRDVLQQMMHRYRSVAESVELRAPRGISPNLLEDGQWVLLVIFTRQQLADAAASLHARSANRAHNSRSRSSS